MFKDLDSVSRHWRTKTGASTPLRCCCRNALYHRGTIINAPSNTGVVDVGKISNPLSTSTGTELVILLEFRHSRDLRISDVLESPSLGTGTSAPSRLLAWEFSPLPCHAHPLSSAVSNSKPEEAVSITPVMLPMVPTTKRAPEHTLRWPHHHHFGMANHGHHHPSGHTEILGLHIAPTPLRLLASPSTMAFRALEPPEEIMEAQEGSTEEEVTLRTNISSSVERSKGSAVSAQRLSKWVSNCIRQCYQIRSVSSPDRIRIHSMRPVSSSAAFFKNFPISEIGRAATWASVHTFAEHHAITGDSASDAIFSSLTILSSVIDPTPKPQTSGRGTAR